MGPQEEERAVEQHGVRFDDRPGQVWQKRHVVRRLAELTPVQRAPPVALDPHIGQEHADVVQDIDTVTYAL